MIVRNSLESAVEECIFIRFTFDLVLHDRIIVIIFLNYPGTILPKDVYSFIIVFALGKV